MSTLTRWRCTPRAFPSSHAASAAAAMVDCAAAPTANEDGSAGSCPVRSANDSASSGSPASCQSPESAACAFTSVQCDARLRLDEFACHAGCELDELQALRCHV